MKKIAIALACTAALSAGAAAQDLKASLEAPAVHIEGQPFPVKVTYTAEADTKIQSWKLGLAALEVDGEAVAERSGQDLIPFAKGSKIELSFDISRELQGKADFSLTVLGEGAQTVRSLPVAPEGLDFMTMPVDQLGRYMALLETDEGTLLVEFWPDVAPNHVRNFLDLCYTGFYDGIGFHRVSSSFMVQGGCPETKTGNRNAWGTGKGPRMVDAEFNKRPHERGVLSMARGTSPNSASSQFFIMTVRYPSLDNKYSAFGKLVSGDDTLTRISNAKGEVGRDGTTKPSNPPRIRTARVLSVGG